MQEIFTFCFLVKPATPEVVGDNHIRHRVENKLDVLCVGGAGHVAVNLLRRRLVLRLKLGLDIHSVSVCVKNTSTQIQIHKYKLGLVDRSIVSVFVSRNDQSETNSICWAKQACIPAPSPYSCANTQIQVHKYKYKYPNTCTQIQSCLSTYLDVCCCFTILLCACKKTIFSQRKLKFNAIRALINLIFCVCKFLFLFLSTRHSLA